MHLFCQWVSIPPVLLEMSLTACMCIEYYYYYYHRHSVYVSYGNVADYVYDNCEAGKGVRFGLFCHYLIGGNYFSDLKSFCNDINGQLGWFESTQEYEEVINETSYHLSDDGRNGHFYTGISIF